jgi:selenocysteine lyase/cysteine desulfurase
LKAKNNGVMSKPLNCQRSQFKLPKDLHFLNCATFSPSSKKVERAGLEAVKRISNPNWLVADHFFNPAHKLRTDLGQLLDVSNPDSIALIPSASYGMAILAMNLHRKAGLKRGQEILVLDAEFPNHRLGLDRKAKELGLHIVSVPKPEGAQIGALWNERILERISSNTCLVVATHVHWVYGTLFDLEAIAKRCREVGALLAIDGTQSVGALPMNLSVIQPDILMVAGYKWMMAPYSTGFVVLSQFFHEGIPVEESWMNRMRSNEFRTLLDYEQEYRPSAQRYNYGEFSNFIQLPMFQAAVEDLLARQPARIQDYCSKLISPFIPELQKLGCQIEETEWRAGHLFGLHLSPNTDLQKVQNALAHRNVVIALRGSVIRVAPNVYNHESDMEALIEGLAQALV